MLSKSTSEWIRTHILYKACESAAFNLNNVSIETIRTHVRERLGIAFNIIATKCAIGYLQYELNRGRSPCYLEWLERSLKIYKETGNQDRLLDVAIYAIFEFENPSFEGTFYDSNDSKKVELEI